MAGYAHHVELFERGLGLHQEPKGGVVGCLGVAKLFTELEDAALGAQEVGKQNALILMWALPAVSGSRKIGPSGKASHLLHKSTRLFHERRRLVRLARLESQQGPPTNGPTSHGRRPAVRRQITELLQV
jgi:hypothetical protein